MREKTSASRSVFCVTVKAKVTSVGQCPLTLFSFLNFYDFSVCVCVCAHTSERTPGRVCGGLISYLTEAGLRFLLTAHSRLALLVGETVLSYRPSLGRGARITDVHTASSFK